MKSSSESTSTKASKITVKIGQISVISPITSEPIFCRRPMITDVPRILTA
ncbi:hypothetical protein Hanom_Chr14g01303861 [Helianthus anomalus]